jgi:hypothetical protein
MKIVGKVLKILLIAVGGMALLMVVAFMSMVVVMSTQGIPDSEDIE